MSFSMVLRIIGVLLMMFSLSMLPPVAVGLWYNDPAWIDFIYSFFMVLIVGVFCWFPCRKIKQDLKVRDGFVIVFLFWVVISAFASLPFLLTGSVHISVTDALFEAVSGVTTTGASVIEGIEKLPRSILYYRQQLHFLGGMGIVVLAVAILPMLSIGGLQLYRAEVPGPAKDTKITPRIAETAKALWSIYVGLVLLCAFFYYAAGMPLFDAVGESFSTVATGGFSMYDASLGYYDKPLINIVGTVFMFLGGVNFTLHFTALQRRSIMCFWQDKEFQLYIGLIMSSAAITSIVLITHGTYENIAISINKALFSVVSLATTTGLTVAPFQEWPSFVPLMLMVLGLIGGSAFSTSGGIKVIRLLLMHKQGIREIKRLIHPQAVMPIKLNNKTVSDELIQAVWGFIAAFILLFTLLSLLLAALGMNIETILGSLIACLANVGAGIGKIADNFAGLNNPSKWVLIFAMIVGRLEIFTVLVLFVPEFWRR